MADPMTKIPRAAWRHVPEAFAADDDDDSPTECLECDIEVAAGWRRRASVIRDGEAGAVDICLRCGSAGFVLATDDDPGASPSDMRPL